MPSRKMTRAVLAGIVIAAAVRAADETLDVAINARVFNGYQRATLADGTFKPEHFAVAEGGRWNGVAVDATIDPLRFGDIVQVIAEPLMRQRYLPTSDPRQTDLLILVFWGVTSGASELQYDQAQDAMIGAIAADAQSSLSSSPAPMGGGWKVQLGDSALNSALMSLSIANSIRQRNNFANAGILGYTDAYVHAQDLRNLGSAAGDTTIDELEASRYFVVLKAYDFPVALKEKKLKLLWESRFSIYSTGNRFDRQLRAMTQAAAKYFGQTTAGLVHQTGPTATVDLGPLRVVEPELAPKR